MQLVFDTETTGLPPRYAALTSPEQPHLVQLAAVLMDGPDREVGSMNVIIRPDGWEIPEASSRIHRITTARALAEGVPLAAALAEFNALLAEADVMVAHNISFDTDRMKVAYLRAKATPSRQNLPRVCTMAACLPILNPPPTPKMLAAGFTKPKPPKLEECVMHFWGESLDGAHDAMIDVRACARVFFHLKTIGC